MCYISSKIDLLPQFFQVAEIVKDRPSWFRECRAVDVMNVLPTANGGTIELLYMQVSTCKLSLLVYISFFLAESSDQCSFECAALCTDYFGATT